MEFIKRGLILFLTVCLFSAASVPCADDFPGSNDAASVSAKNCDEQGPEAAECSPFCVCNCCSSVRSQPAHAIRASLFLPVNELESGHISCTLSSHHPSIWQPPRPVNQQ